MMDQVYTKYVDWPLCATILLFYPCIIQASKVKHPASDVVGCWWLLATALVSAASTPHLGAFEAGGTLSEYPPSLRKYSFEVYVQKELDWKPSVDNKPDIGK